MEPLVDEDGGVRGCVDTRQGGCSMARNPGEQSAESAVHPVNSLCASRCRPDVLRPARHLCFQGGLLLLGRGGLGTKVPRVPAQGHIRVPKAMLGREWLPAKHVRAN